MIVAEWSPDRDARLQYKEQISGCQEAVVGVLTPGTGAVVCLALTNFIFHCFHPGRRDQAVTDTLPPFNLPQLALLVNSLVHFSPPTPVEVRDRGGRCV